GDIIDDI
ncbi:hypothetical protein D030_2994B, partial [Vibrio parahaemolyticus AQ3810]